MTTFASTMALRRLSICISSSVPKQRHSISSRCFSFVGSYHVSNKNPTAARRFEHEFPFTKGFTRRQSTTAQDRTNYRHAILSHSLSHVHTEGWTDDAIASGTLDAGFPPSYIGRASASTSVFGSADLVAFFMDQCNNDLRTELERLKSEGDASDNTDNNDISGRLHRALQYRLSRVEPFVSSKRWHEGMAIGALPQNAYHTAQQLDEMARIVLDYVSNNSHSAGAAQRAAVVTAYAAAELHLVSEGMNARGVSGSSLSYSGDNYGSTRQFLQHRCDEAARLLTEGNSLPDIPLNPAHVAAASAVTTSLFGAALSLAAPTAAAVMGQALPRVMDTLSPLQDYVTKSSGGKDGTRPSDYQVEDLPPFDSNEVIFSDTNTKTV